MAELTKEKIGGWLSRVVSHEGGFTDDRNDSGNWTGGVIGEGELRGTKFGISAAAYPHLDIAGLTLSEAARIYCLDYLAPIGAERFRDGVAFQLFDLAVNSGPRRAIKILQRAVDVKPDGVAGPVTLAAMRELSEGDLIMRIVAERIDFMCRLKSFQHYGRGWMRRIADNLRYGASDSGD